MLTYTTMRTLKKIAVLLAAIAAFSVARAQVQAISVVQSGAREYISGGITGSNGADVWSDGDWIAVRALSSSSWVFYPGYATLSVLADYAVTSLNAVYFYAPNGTSFTNGSLRAFVDGGGRLAEYTYYPVEVRFYTNSPVDINIYGLDLEEQGKALDPLFTRFTISDSFGHYLTGTGQGTFYSFRGEITVLIEIEFANDPSSDNDTRGYVMIEANKP